VKPITIVLTASGSPGASTCIRYLKGIEEREVRVVGVDANPEAVGRHFCDAFETVPASGDPAYVDRLLEVAVRHGADCLIPASSYEVNTVSAAAERFTRAGVKVLASEPEVLAVANNKYRLYDRLKDVPGVRLPDWRLVDSFDAFRAAWRDLDGDNRPLCFKPPYSKGSRGFRYLSGEVSRRDLLLNHKPDSKFMSLREFEEIFADDPDFPELLLMEVVDGEEIDTMVLGMDGECLLITHKTREKQRGGVITAGEQVDRPALDEAVRAIVREAPLRYNAGIQFIGGALIEINPRLSTFLYTPQWVEPYFAVKLALGEYSPDDVRALQKEVPVGLRMIRYFDQIFYRPDAE
jgi:carbamoyl-phosphate synthase large subunit